MSPTGTTASYCRICAAACGILVTVESDSTVSKVRGDPDHPASRGYVCSKGRGLAAWHHRDERLDHPRLGSSQTSWDAVLDDLARSLAAQIAEDGPDGVGLYLATGMAYDSGGQIAAPSWLAAIGSRSFYTAVTVDNAPVLVAAELVAGHPMLSPVWDATAPGVLVLVGTNPVVSHGYGTTLPDPIRYLRDYRNLGGKIWVIDPRRTETAAQADEHLAVRPGSDVAVLAAVSRRLLADVLDDRGDAISVRCTPEDLGALRTVLAPFTDELAAQASGVEVSDLARLTADIRAARGRVAVMCGTGTTMALDGVLVEWLRWVVLILSDSLDRRGGMQFQDGAFGRLRPARPGGARPEPGPPSRPELPSVARQLPAVAMVDEIEQGNLRALVVTGGNPISAFPEPDRVRAALSRLDVLAVVDVLDSELCQLATHLLPATGQLERADITLSSQLAVRSAVQATKAVVAPGADRRPTWWIIAELARRMDHDIIGGLDPSTLDDEAYLRTLLRRSPVDIDDVIAAGPHGLQMPVSHGWVIETMLSNGQWRIAPRQLVERLARHQIGDAPLALVPRREMGWSNSVRYAGEDVAVVRVHPADARVAGLADGDVADVRSEHGHLRATVALDPSVRRGVVSVTHGHAGSSPGQLTSSSVAVDPLTTMPHASGVPVSLTRR